MKINFILFLIGKYGSSVRATKHDRKISDQCVPSLELDGEILERIVEGCEDKQDHVELRPRVDSASKDQVPRALRIHVAGPLASSTMIETVSEHQKSGCSCESVYTWTIHEDEEDYILEDSYMKDIELSMYENEAPESYPSKFQRTSTKAKLSPINVNAQEVPNDCCHTKEPKEKKDAPKKPMAILKNLLRMKKPKDSGPDGNGTAFNKKNILKKMRQFKDVSSDKSDVQTLAMI